MLVSLGHGEDASKHHATLGGGGVDGAVVGDDLHAAPCKRSDVQDELTGGAADVMQTGDEDSVNLSCTDGIEQAVKLYLLAAGDHLVGEDAGHVPAKVGGNTTQATSVACDLDGIEPPDVEGSTQAGLQIGHRSAHPPRTPANHGRGARWQRRR